MRKQLNQIIGKSGRKRVLLFVLFFSLALLGTAIYRFAEQNNWLEEEFANQAIQIELNKSLTQLNLYIKDVESASRGYAVTGDKNFIKGFSPFIDSIHLLYQKLPHIQSKGENTSDSTLFIKLGSLLERKIIFTKRVKQFVDENNYTAARNLIATGEGLILTDSITNTVEQIRPLHPDELRISQNNFLAINSNNNKLAYWSVSVAILLIILTFYFLLVQIKQTKNINERLSLEREHFNITLNSLSEGLISTDNEGQILFMNPSAERLTGWKIFDAKAQPLQHIYDVENEETGMPFENIVSRIINTGGVIELENNTILKAKTGNRYVINNNGAPLLDKNGMISGTVVVFSDITEKKKTEIALQESEKQYKALIENLPEAVYTCDASGYVQLYNKAAVKLWGREPIAGKDLWCGSWKIFNVDGTDLPLDSCPMAIALKEGRPVYGKEIMVQRQDGTLRHVLPNPSPLFNSEGQLTGAVNMLIDVTDKKEREILITKTEEKYRNLFEQASDTILIYSFDGTIYEFNNVICTLSGYTREEFSKLNIKDILIGDIISNQANYDSILAGNAVMIYRQFKRKDGLLVDMEVTTNLLENGRAIAFGRDITKRKKAEEKLRMANQRLTYHMNNSPLGIIEWDKDFFIKKWSVQAERIFGWKETNVVNKHFNDLKLVFVEDAPSVTAIANELMTGAANSNKCLNRNYTKSGEVIHCQWFNSVLKDENGNIQSILSLIQDVTEKEKAENQIIKEKELSDSIINSMPGVFYFYDENVKLLRWNKQLENVTGYSGAELSVMNPAELFEGEDRKYMEERSRKVYAIGSGDAEANFTTKTGKKIPFYFTGLRMMYQDKPSLLGIGIDITDRKKAETITKSAIERYEILSYATSDTIWDWDIISNKMIYNDSITKMFGYELSEVENVVDWWNDKLHSEDYQKVTDSLADIFDNGVQKFQLTYRFRCADGSYKNIFDRAFVVFDEQGKPCRVIGAMQDITYQIEEEMRVAKAIIDAHEAERNFLGAELHDNINQILVGTLLTMGMAKSKELNVRKRDEFVEISMNYIKDAINETRKLSHNLAPVSFEDKSLKDLFENLLVNMNLDNRFLINLHFDETKETSVSENIQVNLYRILQEQTKNILKHADASTIEVDIKFNENSVSLRIYDNGKGFNQKGLKKGIGLSNIKKRAELLSGKFILNSAPGKGCEVIVEIPFEQVS